MFVYQLMQRRLVLRKAAHMLGILVAVYKHGGCCFSTD
jgi:hypothetical protein